MIGDISEEDANLLVYDFDYVGYSLFYFVYLKYIYLWMFMYGY